MNAKEKMKRLEADVIAAANAAYKASGREAKLAAMAKYRAAFDKLHAAGYQEVFA